MKLKLLLAPSIVIFAIVLLIWVVYPAYTNGVDGVKEKYQALEKQKEMTASLLARLDNVKKLGDALDADASAKNTIFNYLPQNKEDEKIIENLNFLAMKNSLAVLNISLFETKDDSTPAVLGGAPTAVPAKKVTAKKLMANFSVFGNYENTRVLLDNLDKMKRFNKISTLEIKSTKKEDQSLSDNLQTNITLEFDYLLNDYKLSDEDINNDVFSKGVFDEKIVDEIVKSKNVDVNNVLPGEIGSNNPFLLQ